MRAKLQREIGTFVKSLAAAARLSLIHPRVEAGDCHCAKLHCSLGFLHILEFRPQLRAYGTTIRSY